MGCLYQLIFPNGKSYIGITSKTAEQRFRGHCQSAVRGITEYPEYTAKEQAISDKKFGSGNYGRLPWLTYLGAAIREFGKENVRVKTLVIANDMQYLKELEIKAIKRLGSHYNTSKGDCPKEIDWHIRSKKWRVTLTPQCPWPRNYFSNKPKFVKDFDTLEEARRIREEIYRQEYLMWMKMIEERSLQDRT